ncbi:MAG: D-alanyl-D-alanine carboxypeptidase [Actinomycetes bacterium]
MRRSSSVPRPALAVAAVSLCAPVLLGVGVATASDASTVGGRTLGHHGVVVDGARAPQVWAQAWVLADATTGQVLAAKNAHVRHRPASTLKTLTAVTLLPRLSKNRVYKVQWRDAAVEGSAVGIVPGATYTVDQLFYGMLLPSGNDAAHALACAAGGMHHTVVLMQRQAERLQANDTTVVNPSGLDADGQYTSAYDLALFARAGLSRSDFRRYVGTVTTSFPGGMPKHKSGKRPTYQIYNQNPLLLTGYRGVVGVKTGYTTLAGRTFVGAAKRDGHLLIVSLMGVVEPSGAAAERLLDWGFAHRTQVSPVGVLVDPLPKHSATTTTASDTSVVTPPTAPVAAQGNGVSDLWVGMIVIAVAALGAAVVWSVRVRRSRSKRQERIPFTISH